VAQEAFMRQGLAVGPLCALVNNNSRCYDDAAEFAEHLGDTLSTDLRVSPWALGCTSLP
jgi:hypothetical protein